MVIRLEPKGVLIFAIQKSDYFFYFEIATPAYGGLAMTAKLIFPCERRGSLRPFVIASLSAKADRLAIFFSVLKSH